MEPFASAAARMRSNFQRVNRSTRRTVVRSSKLAPHTGGRWITIWPAPKEPWGRREAEGVPSRGPVRSWCGRPSCVAVARDSDAGPTSTGGRLAQAPCDAPLEIGERPNFPASIRPPVMPAHRPRATSARPPGDDVLGTHRQHLRASRGSVAWAACPSLTGFSGPTTCSSATTAGRAGGRVNASRRDGRRWRVCPDLARRGGGQKRLDEDPAAMRAKPTGSRQALFREDRRRRADDRAASEKVRSFPMAALYR